MANLNMDFEWPIDDSGYSIVDWTRETIQAETQKRQEWLLDDGGPPAISEGSHVVRNGGTLRLYRPLDFHPTLFMQFANLERSQKGCVSFANSFGYLGSGYGMNSFEDGAGPGGEALHFWCNVIDEMRRMVELWQSNPNGLLAYSGGWKHEELMGVLAPGYPHGRPVFKFRPRTLLGAMRLQFALAVHTEASIKSCDFCGTWFEAGKSGRRRHARYCSDNCRIQYHNREKLRNRG